MHCKSVLLPPPEGPMSTFISPSYRSRLTDLRISRPPSLTERPCTRISGFLSLVFMV